MPEPQSPNQAVTPHGGRAGQDAAFRRALPGLREELGRILEQQGFPPGSRVALVDTRIDGFGGYLEERGYAISTGVTPPRNWLPDAERRELLAAPEVSDVLLAARSLARTIGDSAPDVVLLGNPRSTEQSRQAYRRGRFVAVMTGRPVLLIAARWPGERPPRRGAGETGGGPQMPVLWSGFGAGPLTTARATPWGRAMVREQLSNRAGEHIPAAALDDLLNDPILGPRILPFEFVRIEPDAGGEGDRLPDQGSEVPAAGEQADLIDEAFDWLHEIDGQRRALLQSLLIRERRYSELERRYALDQAALWESLEGVYASNSWRFTRPMREARSGNWRYFLIELPAALLRRVYPLTWRAVHLRLLLLLLHWRRPVIVFRPSISWNIPLFQRPQHIAQQLAASGTLYFYCSPNPKLDFDVEGIRRVSPRCWLTNRFDLADGIRRRKVIHVYAADPDCDLAYVKQVQARGDVLLYEYIDELHDHITGPRAEALGERHQYMLEERSVLVVTSADQLYEDVLAYRPDGHNVAMVSNGVDYGHFAVQREGVPVPDELRGFVDRGRPVIGYHGALATWFDYELVKKLARERPDYQILLIGWDYDSSLKTADFAAHENLRVIGPIPYATLPRYSIWFDVATIPFQVYGLTHSTSPIKLFEYMALGHPIVTTDMKECRKYESVMIAESHDHFVQRVDEGLARRGDPAYAAVLKREALANTWQAKGEVMAGLIRRALGEPPAETGP